MIEFLLHRLFFYLGTPSGELFKRSIALLVTSVATLIATLEYIRTRSREAKLLAWGFFFLALKDAIVAAGYVVQIFGNTDVSGYKVAFPLVDYAIETLGLIFLAAAFISPVFKKRTALAIRIPLAALALLTVLIETAWIISYRVHQSRFIDSWGALIFLAFDILLILSFIGVAAFHRMRYRVPILLAFTAYLVNFIVTFIQYAFFQNRNPKLNVIGHPLPIISVGLLILVSYLRLADKAELYTKLKRSEQRVSTEKEVGKMKDEFVSVVSHELRTPLTSMKLYLSLLREGKFGSNTPKQEEALQTVSSEGDRLGRLIEDLLSLSKLESGKVKLHPKESDISEIFHDPFYYELARRKGITTTIDVPRPFEVMVDAERLRQIFINLISNATKFTQEGGTINVQAHKTEAYWQFSVQDTGRGIDRKHQKRLFSKFYQVDDYMTRKEGGFGLGLSIVKKLVDMHHGKITLASTLGKGTTFTIRFPNKVLKAKLA